MIPQKIGRYQIRASLIDGDSPTLFRAYDPNLAREVALKVLPPQLLHHASYLEDFNKDARRLASLEHDAIVPLYDFGVDSGQPFIVMRLMRGGSLAERLKSGPLSLAEASDILLRLASVIDLFHQHEGMASYSNLKPSTVLFDEYDAPHLAGLAIESSRQVGLIESPEYMSAEELNGQPLNQRGNVYRLGIILFEMLTAHSPFAAPTPAAVMKKHFIDPVPNILRVNPELPADCQAIIERALAKEPAQRYATAKELSDAFQKLVAGAAPDSIASSSAPITEGLFSNSRGRRANDNTPPTPLKRGVTSEKSPLERGFRGVLPFSPQIPEEPAQEAPPIAQEAPSIVEEAPAIVEEAPAIVEEAPAIVKEARPIVKEAPAIDIHKKIWDRSNDFSRSGPAETPRVVTTVQKDYLNIYIPEEAPLIPEEAPAIVKEAPFIVEEAPAIVEEAPFIVKEAPLIPEEAPPIVEEAPFIVEEAPPIAEEAVAQNSPRAAFTPQPLAPRGEGQRNKSSFSPLSPRERGVGGVRAGLRWLGATVMVALLALLGWFAVDYLSYGVGSTFVSQKDSMTLVYVPEGEFLMGALPDDAEAEADEKPQRLVSLDAYWIDQSEVTNAMFARFVEETGHQTDAERDNWGYVYLDKAWTQMDGATWRHPNGPDSNLDGLESYPVVQVSWHDANAYCKWVERRLPTEAEWEKAARGSLMEEGSRKYAWGNELPTNAWQLDGIHKVASYANGISPYQAFDMSSNAWEWTADWYNEQYHQNTASHNPKGTGGEERTYRGGGFNNETALIRATIRQRANPIFRVNQLGFRCALPTRIGGD